MKKLLVLLAMVFLGGCATYNEARQYGEHPLTQEQFYQVQENRYNIKAGMTEQEVIDLVGMPAWKTMQIITAETVWVYSSRSLNAAVFGWHGRELSIFFKKGRVTKVGQFTL